jgi:tRNA (adenine57-N1/adenine58-N1)-methyltransferase catalytic subunit
MHPPYFFWTKDGKTKVFHNLAKYEGKDGIIQVQDIEAADDGQRIPTHMDRNLIIHSATPIDVIESFRRGPQTIILKDAAYIVGKGSVSRESVIIDAGTGSGSMAAYFALHAKKVYSFELRAEFLEISKKNLERIKDNPLFCDIELINDDVQYANNYINERADLIFLDVPEPWNYYAILKPLLKDSGKIACYVPNATQALECTNNLNGFIIEEACEIMLRTWKFSGRIAKPEKDLLHTAFLVFARNSRT